MYSSFNDIFLAPAPAQHEYMKCGNKVVFTPVGRYVRLTHQMLLSLIPDRRYRVRWYDTSSVGYYVYGYVFVYHLLDPVRGNIVQYYRYKNERHPSQYDEEELVSSTWILDIVRSKGDEAFTEFHSGLERNVAVDARVIICDKLSTCMLAWAREDMLRRIRSTIRNDILSVDLTNVTPTSELFAQVLVNHANNRALYAELRHMYTHMRACLIVYLRRFVVPDVARMIVAIAHPW